MGESVISGDQAQKGRWELEARAEQRGRREGGGGEASGERPESQSWRMKQGVEEVKQEDCPRLIGRARHDYISPSPNASCPRLIGHPQRGNRKV